jgi:hypothetical protein
LELIGKLKSILLGGNCIPKFEPTLLRPKLVPVTELFTFKFEVTFELILSVDPYLFYVVPYSGD